MDIFKNITNNQRVIPPVQVSEELLIHFPDAKSTEWSTNKGNYEVIFYEKDTEKIARFSEKGVLQEYRINLKPEHLAKSLPRSIYNSAKKEGEIMNCITVHQAEKIYYEFIVRDPELTRYLLILDSEGTNLSLNKL